MVDVILFGVILFGTSECKSAYQAEKLTILLTCRSVLVFQQGSVPKGCCELFLNRSFWRLLNDKSF